MSKAGRERLLAFGRTQASEPAHCFMVVSISGLSSTGDCRRVTPTEVCKGIKDERTVRTACPQPAVTNGLQRPTSLEGKTHAQLILAKRTTLHLKAEYICADMPSRPTFPLQSRAGPYIRNSLFRGRQRCRQVVLSCALPPGYLAFEGL
jgi:hypothetical protein